MSGQGKIADYVRQLEQLATPDLRRKLSQQLGGVMIRLINDQIDRGVDPYGLDLKRRTDGVLPLQGLKNTFTASFDEGRARVSSSKWYSAVHQKGWTIAAQNAPYLRFRLPNGAWVSRQSIKIPQRMMVPTEELGLGSTWSTALIEKTTRFLRDHLQGRG